MEAENFEERKRGLQRFGLLYAVSLALVAVVVYALTVGEASPAEGTTTATPAQDKALIASLRADLDSARRHILRLQSTLGTKDSLISMLASKPIFDGRDSIAEKDFIARLHKEDVNGDRDVQELRDENAELRLAEANCDLSRADARQVVYNEKQRQVLLTDALSILTQLIQSPDVEIQKKARQKMAELRSIVSTVHD